MKLHTDTGYCRQGVWEEKRGFGNEESIRRRRMCRDHAGRELDSEIARKNILNPQNLDTKLIGDKK